MGGERTGREGKGGDKKGGEGKGKEGKGGRKGEGGRREEEGWRCPPNADSWISPWMVSASFCVADRQESEIPVQSARK